MPQLKNDPTQEVRASRFVLTDAQGRERAVLETNEQGEPSLELRDANGLPRVFIACLSSGATVAICDENGAASLAIDTGHGMPPVIHFADVNNTPRIRFGPAGLFTYDENGAPIDDIAPPPPPRPFSATTWTKVENGPLFGEE